MRIKKTELATLFLITIIIITFCGCHRNVQKNSAKKPAIVMVAFGTSVIDSRRVFDHIDKRVRERYPDFEIRWAFTSQFIIEKLKRKGIITQNPVQVAADLKNKGFNSAVFQSLHVVPGQEFNEISKIRSSGLSIAIGKALLSDDHDIEKVVDALSGFVKQDSSNIIAGHGNGHHPEFNKQLLAFAQKIEAIYPNVFVCSVEGQPGIDKLKKANILAKQTKSANFIPLMIVAGNHIMNDVVGDEPDSWMNIVAAKENSRAQPLGYNDKIINVYLEHLNDALLELEN